MVKEDIPFRREERSYFSTPTRCRLATFEEAKNNLEIIKELNLLEKWDRVRLLDGWILGPGYGFQMGNDFKGCLGYMLLIETDASGFPYADVNLSPLGKDVALFLCVDDWNYEVVYWLLNSWSNSEIMNLGDVRGGNIPFSNAAEFVERNEMLSSVARKLGEEGGAAREKEGKAKYSGKDSVKELLSGMIKILTKEKDIVGFIGDGIWHFRSYEGDEYHLPPSVETGDVAETLWSSVCEAGDVADAYWSFVCETFAGYAVEVCALTSLLYIRRKMKTKRTSEKNLMIATSILLYLSDYQSDIILEPLHSFSGSCAGKILSHAAKEAVGDPHCLREKLKGNAMWRCYDETGNYGILDKLLFIADVEQADENVKGMLLQCGAQRRQQSMHIRGREKAAKFKDEDLHTEIGRALLRRCDKEGRNHFVNARDERGRTALHRASQRMNSTLCKLLIEFGASVNAQDQNDMTPLHCALEVGPYALEGEGIGRISEVGKAMNVLMESPHATESLHLKDVRERTPLDIAAAKNDNPLTAKLLSKFEEPEAYFDKVDEKQLLRNSLLLGSVDIVHKLLEKGITLPAGDCDNDRKTVLHLAAMCDNESSALEIIQFLGNMEDMVAKQDRKGRTALHEAALKGHLKVCKLLLGKNPELIYKKDRDGRNPLYDAVKAEDNRTDLHESLFAVYLEKVKFQKDLVDRRGVTPLHVAASEGKAKVVGKLLFEYKVKENYLSRGDFMGQTALHKAVKRGDVDMVKILLKHGAHPLRERDNDGRTALHYAVQAETGDKHKMVDMLLNKCASDQEKSLLLWASAAGLGTADQNLREDDSLRIFLADKKREMQGSTGTRKDNLLQTAASMGDTEMTKELISKGYQIRDIQDEEWRKELGANKANVEKVLRQIERIKEQGNDKPAIADTLGRLDYAQGLAALFLNPYIKSPIAVGITGSWGAGKSSLMLQTQRILLTTAVQMALLESSMSSNSALEFPDTERYELSKKGKRTLEDIYRHIKNGKRVQRNIFIILWDNICTRVKQSDMKNELEKVLNNYDFKYRKLFKALAAMDSNDMFQTNPRRPKSNPSAREDVPAILTVQYNAWKYRNDTEALAGLAVEITQELEGIMNQAQWLNACWRNTWKNKKHILWIEIFFPSLLALILVSSLTWIAWVVFDSGKLKEFSKAKYAWPPVAIFTVVWTVTKSVMSILKPVSTQLMQYISLPDHTDKLGYQERVISDITFLKNEIGKKASWVFIVIGWFCTTFTVLWRLINESWATSLFLNHRRLEKSIDAPKVAPASGSNLRIIVFVDDLDRCQDSVILQVLSAINLVLAVCEINVVIGMDKRLIQRAILKKYGDVKANRSLKASEELADMYLQKIIQLQLDLPDPSDEESRRFLKEQLGVLENENEAFEKNDRSSSTSDGSSSGGRPSSSYGEIESTGQNPQFEIEVQSPMEITKMDGRNSGRVDGGKNMQSLSEKNWLKLFKFHVRNVVRSVCAPGALCNSKTGTGPTDLSGLGVFDETGRISSSQKDGDATIHGGQENPSSSILKREILFVRYSKGEEDAILYFQRLATGCRKLPREWKRLLNYHRLVWYIFSLGTEAKNLAGWQVQLITWIFVCWEWQENMNLVIEKWKEIVDLKISESNDLSLLMIVEYLMEEHKGEIPATSNEGTKRREKLREPTGNVAKTNNKEETESGRIEQEELNGKVDGEILENKCGEEHIAGMNMKDNHDALEKSLAELKKEMKELKELVSHGLMKDIMELKKQVSDELTKDRNEIKEHMVKKQNGKIEENMESKKIKLHNLENWKRMKSTLERYDVTMDGIQAFQRFRFYCIAGYLQRPACEEPYRAVFNAPQCPACEDVYMLSDENPNACSVM